MPSVSQWKMADGEYPENDWPRRKRKPIRRTSWFVNMLVAKRYQGLSRNPSQPTSQNSFCTQLYTLGIDYWQEAGNEASDPSFGKQ